MAEELKLDTIIEKEADDLTDEERTHLNENKDKLTGEQLKKFDSVIQNGESKDEKNENKDEETKDENGE